MVRETTILTRQEISAEVDIVATISAIENAMGEFEKGQDFLPPKAIYMLPAEMGIAACITGYTKATDLLSMKLGQERSNNSSRGLPTTNSWITAFCPETGELMMICDGMLPTMYRTAAAAAVSAKYLARETAKTLTVIGAGQLGRQCIRAVSSVRDFQRILVCDRIPQAADQVAGELSDAIGRLVEVAEVRDACCDADVVVTATNSRTPIVEADWIQAGTHLCCMGTDLPEKIECEMSLLPKCRIYADVVEHALQRGEVSQAVEQGLLNNDCYQGSLGQVINGQIPGRTDQQQITMYDGVGIGIQDTTVVRAIYDQATSKGIGTRIAFS